MDRSVLQQALRPAFGLPVCLSEQAACRATVAREAEVAFRLLLGFYAPFLALYRPTVALFPLWFPPMSAG